MREIDRLSVKDLKILKFILMNPGAVLTTISRELKIPPSSLHSTLAKLQLMGLIERRDKGYFITEKGIEAMKEILSIVKIE